MNRAIKKHVREEGPIGRNLSGDSQFYRDSTLTFLSAGHADTHPRAKTAQRFLDYSIPISRILRTDRNDNESDYSYGDLEWAQGRGTGADGIRDGGIVIKKDKRVTLKVNYE
jgi:hypothetical protein